ncbi:hypothetical protein RN001_007774 [Aquatica leii]|uniref:THAP-type domain-containing protein n=1 Tax=Aquatica leii TaxID=1421715 RepID=A0AAN7SP04_9COLE|nr:hypothetical protein RN001_007774 [Aquatica leii]
MAYCAAHIMPHACAVVDCTNNSKREWRKKYFLIPSERDNRGRIIEQRVQRRRAWIQALHREDLTETKIKYIRICSDHFFSGTPATFGDDTNPDYIPHINMGYGTTKGNSRKKQKHYDRVKSRKMLKSQTEKRMLFNEKDVAKNSTTSANLNLQCLQSQDVRMLENVTDVKVETEIEHSDLHCLQSEDIRMLEDVTHVKVETEIKHSNLQCLQSEDVRMLEDVTHVKVETEIEHSNLQCLQSQDVGMLENVPHVKVETEIEHTKVEEYQMMFNDLMYVNNALYESRRMVQLLSLNEAAFSGNDKKTKFYTGFPSFVALMKIFNLMVNDIPSTTVLTKFQHFLLTLMHLRLNLMFSDLAYRFGISTQTASRVFHCTVHVFYKYMKNFIIWPDREDVISTMPESFKKAFGNKVAVIIDCFEIKIGKSSSLKVQTTTRSNDKQHNTIKIVIGICPQGAIIFIAKAFGGRTSDRVVIEKCGILEKLLPGDLVLTNTGFLIHNVVKMRCAQVINLKGKKQLSFLEVEETRELAAVRIHVKKIIGLLCRKYRILHTVKRRVSQKNILLIDKVLQVACGLTNLCPPVVT